MLVAAACMAHAPRVACNLGWRAWDTAPSGRVCQTKLPASTIEGLGHQNRFYRALDNLSLGGVALRMPWSLVF